MGRVTNSVDTRWWTQKNVKFLKANRFRKRTAIARMLKRDHSGVAAKMRALGLSKRKCDEVPLTSFQKQLMYGSLLGDGSIALGNSDKNPRFSEGHSLKQKNYLLFKYKKLKPYSGKFIEYKTKWGGEAKFSTVNHKEFHAIRSMFYNRRGKKVIKKLTLLQIIHPVALAMWFGDDGSKEKNSYRLATGAYSIAELKYLIRWLKNKFHINAYLHKHGKYCYLSIREDRFLFTKIVKPHLPKSMHYKLF